MPESRFAVLVRALLAEHGLSMRALARQVPIDAGQLCRVLNDQRPPSPELAGRCDAILGAGGLLIQAAQRRRQHQPSGADGQASSCPDVLGRASGMAGWGRDPTVRSSVAGYPPFWKYPTIGVSGPRPGLPATGGGGVGRADGWDETVAGFAAVVRATWPGNQMLPVGTGVPSGDGMGQAAVWGLPSGASFPGAGVRVQVEPATTGATGAVRMHCRGHREPTGPAGPGLVVAAQETHDSVAYYMMDARRAQHRGVCTGSGSVVVPRAYQVDDLTVAALWALTNLDQALLADDAALAHIDARARAGACSEGREVWSGELPDLSTMSQLWLGSNFCARHITTHFDRLRDVPVFWTREQRGEEACTWLLFAHKLDYLRVTTARYASTVAQPVRVFCVPETTVATSPRIERIMLLLAVALIEAHGVAVHVTTDPGYGQLPGFVWAGSGPSLLATWVRTEQVWHTGTTTAHHLTVGFADAARDAAAASVIAAASPGRRLEHFAYYLGLDWRWLRRRATAVSEVGWAGLLRPRSRLLSVEGLDVACRFLAAAA